MISSTSTTFACLKTEKCAGTTNTRRKVILSSTCGTSGAKTDEENSSTSSVTSLFRTSQKTVRIIRGNSSRASEFSWKAELSLMKIDEMRGAEERESEAYKNTVRIRTTKATTQFAIFNKR